MDESRGRFAPGPLIGAVYALGLGLTTALGAYVEKPWTGKDWFEMPPGMSDAGNALQMPAFALLVGVVAMLAGVGLLLRQRWGRVLFLIAMPLAAIGLASNHVDWLWDQDVPYTLMLALAYGPVAFLLSNPSTQRSFGKEDNGFGARGGWVALGLVVIAVVVRIWIKSMEPRGGGPGWPGYAHIDFPLSEYVAKLATVEVLLAHFVLGFLAIAWPARWRPGGKEDFVTEARAGPSSGLVARWLLLSCAGGILGGYAGTLLAALLLPFRGPDVEPETWVPFARAALHLSVWGLFFGVAQALALRQLGLGFLRWGGATCVGAVAGALLGAWVDWARTSGLEEPLSPQEIVRLLVQISLFQGIGVGVAQALAGRGRARARIAWALAFAAAWVGVELFAIFLRDVASMAPVSEARDHTLWYMLQGFVVTAGRGLVIALCTLPWLGELEETESG